MPRAPHDPEMVQMSFLDHLEDLRRRMLYAIYGAVVTTLFTVYYGKELVVWLCKPLAHAQRNAGLPAQTITTHVTAGFFIDMKVALIAGLVLASPWIVYQIWKFIAAGLYAGERHAVSMLAPFSTIMTVLGVLFAYYFLIPMALAFLIYFSASYPAIPADQPNALDKIAQFARTLDPSTWDQAPHSTATAPAAQPTAATGTATGPAATNPASTQSAAAAPSFLEFRSDDPPEAQWTEGRWWLNTSMQEVHVITNGQLRVIPLSAGVQNMPLIELGDYINFVCFMILASVITFQLPVLMLLLGWTRLVNPALLGRLRKYILFVCFLVAAVVTPTGDPINMTLMALPMYVLFEFGLLVMRISYRRSQARAAAALAEDESDSTSDPDAL